MNYQLSDKELCAVIQLPDVRRYEYFVKRVADWEVLWSLKSDSGWVLAADDEGRQLVPVWPHAQFASACATSNWAGAVATPIDLRVWLERWTPGMTGDARYVAVFPVPSGKGVVVLPERLAQDLREERAQME